MPPPGAPLALLFAIVTPVSVPLPPNEMIPPPPSLGPAPIMASEFWAIVDRLTLGPPLGPLEMS